MLLIFVFFEGIIVNFFYFNFYYVFNFYKKYRKDEVLVELVLWIFWRIWKNRNDFQYKGRDYDVISILNKVREDVEDWKRRNEGEKKEVK